MQVNDDCGAPAGLPLWAAANLQVDLMMASNDLDRLQTLLADACRTLADGFYGASEQIRAAHGLRHGDEADAAATPYELAIQHLGTAITALQFQDMASQLIAHTHKRLRVCADRLAREAFAADDEDGDAVVDDVPLRPNPVTQAEMDAGSIELF
jgi:hypothetical protein